MFNNIRHMSFDVWNTLIIPNKEFARLRSAEIANTFGVDFNEGKQKYTDTKRFLDTAAELTGFGTTVNNVWAILNAQFKNSPVGSLLHTDLIQLQLRVQDIFANNLPTLLPEVVDALHAVRERNITINILSNTNFIGGAELMEHVFEPQLGEDFFNFELFSDEMEMAKPNDLFFDAMIDRADQLYQDPVISRKLTIDQIMHIGDNAITDVGGAARAGIVGLFVAGPADLAEKLLKLKGVAL